MKIFRDPIYNVIDLDTGDEIVNELLIRLIDCKEFQRLRYLKQLGFTYFAYPSANHTRFEHSLGVAYLAKRFLDRILSIKERALISHPEGSQNRDKFIHFFQQIKQDRSATIVAALLHDIGHGPLSHVLEYFTGEVTHEDWTREIIFGNTEVNELLMLFSDKNPEKKINPIRIWDILNNTNESYPSAKILAGQLDVDRMEYMLRDSHMTGAGYGKFDVEWIFNVLTIGIVGEKVEIGIDLGKGLSVAEDFIMARIYMYKNIFFHKTNQVAGHMLKALFQRVKDLPEESPDKLLLNDSLRKIFLSSHRKESAPELLDDYLGITDIDLFYGLKSLQKSGDEVLRRLSGGLLSRNLLKKTELKNWNMYQTDDKGKYYTAYISIDLEKERVPYRSDDGPIILFDKDGAFYEISELSDVVRTTLKNEEMVLGYFVEDESLLRKH